MIRVGAYFPYQGGMPFMKKDISASQAIANRQARRSNTKKIAAAAVGILVIAGVAVSAVTISRHKKKDFL